MKNEVFNGIFLKELANAKMCMPDMVDWSVTKHIVPNESRDLKFHVSFRTFSESSF